MKIFFMKSEVFLSLHWQSTTHYLFDDSKRSWRDRKSNPYELVSLVQFSEETRLLIYWTDFHLFTYLHWSANKQKLNRMEGRQGQSLYAECVKFDCQPHLFVCVNATTCTAANKIAVFETIFAYVALWYVGVCIQTLEIRA